MKHGSDSIEIGMINLFLILYADDTVIISESAEGLQKQLNDLYDYCNEWKLKVNTLKTSLLYSEIEVKCRQLTSGIMIEIALKL